MPGASYPKPGEREGVGRYFMMICTWESKDEAERIDRLMKTMC